jgi:hypothetical protein
MNNTEPEKGWHQIKIATTNSGCPDCPGELILEANHRNGGIRWTVSHEASCPIYNQIQAEQDAK